MGRKNCSHSPCIDINQISVSDKVVVTNHFGHCSKIGSSVHEGARNDSKNFLSDEFVDDRGERSEFRFEKCTSNEVIEIVIILMDVNLRIFKVTMMYLLPSLIHIINISLTTGTFLHALKQAKVILRFKGDLKSDRGNWRPISILLLFPKILEKVVHERLYDHLTKYGLLSETQVSFRRGHSTSHAAIHLVDFVNNCLQKVKFH